MAVALDEVGGERGNTSEGFVPGDDATDGDGAEGVYDVSHVTEPGDVVGGDVEAVECPDTRGGGVIDRGILVDGSWEMGEGRDAGDAESKAES